MDPALFDAYRRTAFTAQTPRGRLTLRVGRRCPELDDLLLTHGVTAWAYVTAFNPGSVPLSDDDNAARQLELERLIDDQALVAYRGHGIGDDGGWPPEPSLLILGIDRERARQLGRRFGQAAIVFGERGAEAQLVACEGED